MRLPPAPLPTFLMRSPPQIYPCVKTLAYRRSQENCLVIDARTLSNIPVSSVTKLVRVSSTPAPDTFVCNKMMGSDTEAPFDPERHRQKRLTLYEGGAGVDRETHVWVSVFYDSYTSAPTRYKSVGGLYMTIANMRLRHQKKLENVFLLSLVPSGADFFQVWEPYRKELVRLETVGFQVSNTIPLLVLAGRCTDLSFSSRRPRTLTRVGRSRTGSA